MNTWLETVIYYKGKLKKDNETLLRAYRFAVEVMSYTTEYEATHIGVEAEGWKPVFLPIKEYGIKFEKFLEEGGKEIEDFNVFTQIRDTEMIYECVQFHYRIEKNYLMFSFNREIAEELELERIAAVMRNMMEEITEGEIFESESSFEISGYITGKILEKQLEEKEVIYDLIKDYDQIEEVTKGKDKNWGKMRIEELIY